MNKSEERYIRIALGVIIVGTFMAVLDSSIVNVAIPKMMTIFGASTEAIEWVLTGYMITMAIVIPLTGYLTDRFGSKRVYIFALSVFTIGSGLCGLATSTETMVAARVIQAIGGGMIMPVGMSMIYMIVPKEKRGFAIGIWGIAAMAAPAIGPTLSGYIIQYLNWRIIFTLNIPIGIVGVTLAVLYLKDTGEHHKRTFDFLGAITSGVCLYTLLLALSEGNQRGWESPYIVGLFITSIICLFLFINIELSSAEPLLELRVFKYFSFTLSVCISSITAIAMFGVVFLIPLYLQNLRGYTPVQTGIMMLPAALVTGIMMPFSGRIFDKHGARWVTLIGICLLAICTWQLTKLTLETSYITVVLVLALRGLGMGLSSMPSQTAGMNDIPQELVARATAINTTIRQVAGSLGIAILTTILARRTAFHGVIFGENINLAAPKLQEAQRVMQNTLMQHGINPGATKTGLYTELSSMLTKQTVMAAMNDTFLIATLIVIVGIPLSLLLRSKKLKIIDEEIKLIEIVDQEQELEEETSEEEILDIVNIEEMIVEMEVETEII